jgi:hypothetical protein
LKGEFKNIECKNGNTEYKFTKVISAMLKQKKYLKQHDVKTHNIRKRTNSAPS